MEWYLKTGAIVAAVVLCIFALGGMEVLGLKEPSEVIAIIVERVISLLETNGTSLQNHANVDNMSMAIQHCVAEVSKLHQITVLTFYKSQKFLSLKKLDYGTFRIVFADYVTARRSRSRT